MRVKPQVNYYPYGLKIAAISAKAFDAPANPYQYQGDYAEFDDETGWNDFELRSYDPQIGRFIQADPYDQYPSPYTGMGNDPVNGVDPNGGFYFGINWLGISDGLMTTGQIVLSRAINTVVFAGVGFAIDKAAGGNGWTGAAIGGGAGLGATFVNWGAVGGALANAGSWLGNNIGSLMPGALGGFSTIEKAARDWGKKYNDNSIVDKVEYGSSIYEYKEKGKKRYDYSVPNKANRRGAAVKISDPPKGTKKVADIHSHGNSWGEDPGIVAADNNFSSTDMWSNVNGKIDGYLTTPDGSLKKYDYKLRKQIPVSTDMPSDPKYPKLRKNQIDPYILPKNEPSVLMP